MQKTKKSFVVIALILASALTASPTSAQTAFNNWVGCLRTKAIRFANSSESVEAVVRISIIACRRENQIAMQEDSKTMDAVGLFEIDKVLLEVMESRLKR
jgi:hypothetical protein